MIGELIAIAIIVTIGIFLLQMEHHAKKVKIIIIALIGILLYFSILGIFSSEQIDFTSPRSIVSGVYLYAGWIGQTATSLWNIGTDAAHMVGNAIKINNTEQEKPRR